MGGALPGLPRLPLCLYIRWPEHYGKASTLNPAPNFGVRAFVFHDYRLQAGVPDVPQITRTLNPNPPPPPPPPNPSIDANPQIFEGSGSPVLLSDIESGLSLAPWVVGV